MARKDRILLVLLTVWALAMIVPDFWRLGRPLGSFGFNADGDGLVTDALGPFAHEADFPAWQAGLRHGDRLDLSKMRCIPLNTKLCATALAVLGQLQLVESGRDGSVALKADESHGEREIALVARARPFSWWISTTLALDEIAGVLVILAAAWLVWTRPARSRMTFCRMTWGFFLYVIWFNPGQSYQYYAWLQTMPAALLAQHLLGALAQGAGLAGFLLFALRAPGDMTEPRWLKVEKALPALALLLALLLALGAANAFGFPAEFFLRAGLLSGFAVAACALVLLLARRDQQPPADRQRLRWVIWGCLIGLPSLTVADLAQQTTLLDALFGEPPPPDEFWDLLRLVNGILCLFVFEALRRPLVVSVSIPLRRVTILGLLLSAPTLFAHEQFTHASEGIKESLTLPGWVWLLVGTLALFVISRLHELATHHADRFFHRAAARAGVELGSEVLRAPDLATIEMLLAEGAANKLKLASASIFRKEETRFLLASGVGWNENGAGSFAIEDPLVKQWRNLRAFDLTPDVAGKEFPPGLAQPVLAIPVADRFDCFALALYGPHASGANLNEDEREVLARLAALAADKWSRLEKEELRRRVQALEGGAADGLEVFLNSQWRKTRLKHWRRRQRHPNQIRQNVVVAHRALCGSQTASAIYRLSG